MQTTQQESSNQVRLAENIRYDIAQKSLDRLHNKLHLFETFCNWSRYMCVFAWIGGVVSVFPVIPIGIQSWAALIISVLLIITFLVLNAFFAGVIEVARRGMRHLENMLITGNYLTFNPDVLRSDYISEKLTRKMKSRIFLQCLIKRESVYLLYVMLFIDSIVIALAYIFFV